MGIGERARTDLRRGEHDLRALVLRAEELEVAWRVPNRFTAVSVDVTGEGDRVDDGQAHAPDSLRGTSARAVSTRARTPAPPLPPTRAPLKPRTKSSSVVHESSTPSC